MSKNIRTLDSVRNGDDGGSESDEEGRNRRQGYYVGGSENSGQQVLGPRGPRDENFSQQNFFDAARRGGAEAVTGEAAEPRGNQARGGQATRGAEGGPATREICLTMWTNGFSIDDGPLRAMDDPASQQFLREIVEGHIPAELRRQYPNQQLELRMERKLEEWRAPPPKPFAGSGQRLGAVVPEVVTSSTTPAASTSTANDKPAEDVVAKAQAEVKLDESAPITQVQVRLPSGSRLIGRFNHSHTVADLRAFVFSASPTFLAFQLMTTYPNKVIEDEKLTLKDAGLIGALVVVKPVL